LLLEHRSWERKQTPKANPQKIREGENGKKIGFKLDGTRLQGIFDHSTSGGTTLHEWWNNVL